MCNTPFPAPHHLQIHARSVSTFQLRTNPLPRVPPSTKNVI